MQSILNQQGSVFVLYPAHLCRKREAAAVMSVLQGLFGCLEAPGAARVKEAASHQSLHLQTYLCLRPGYGLRIIARQNY